MSIAGTTANDEKHSLAAAEMEVEVEVGAGRVQEECFEMRAGDRVSYRFLASAPVNFNIHHHQGDNVLYLVKSVQVQAQGLTSLDVDQQRRLCWMWTNVGAGSVTLHYDVLTETRASQ